MGNKVVPESSWLTLGWQMTPAGDPRYWLRLNAKAGLQSHEDLVRIPAASMATHTAVIAQSGSGKSFFLGRLIEELLLRTRARCLILDPNADFRRIHEVADETLWMKACYDPVKRLGKLPHERSREEFEPDWNAITKRILLGTGGALVPPYQRLRLWWPFISMDFISEGLDPVRQIELAHCHLFLRRITELTERLKRETPGVIRLAERIADETAEALRKFGPVAATPTQVLRTSAYTIANEFSLNALIPATSPEEMLMWYAATAFSYVSEEMRRFYFAKVAQLEGSGILAQRAPSPLSRDVRLVVVDLPSIGDRSARLLAVDAILANEWKGAMARWTEALEAPSEEEDRRVPCFIVLDEAHTLIPREPADRVEAALRARFRTIVAEGRKYGLFLILVSQRPDKLDHMVLSECDNKAVMRLGSETVLEVTRKALSLEEVPPRVLGRCLQLGQSRALIVGNWAGMEAQLLYTAARRTREAGRNLCPEWWALPPEQGPIDPMPSSKAE